MGIGKDIRLKGNPDRFLDITLFGIALAAVAWCLSDLMSGGQVPVYRDLMPFVYPYRGFLAASLLQGDVPFWNPFVGFGVPFMASLHAGVFYPPSLILLIPFPLGFNLFLLVHFAIGGAGALLWLRSENASRAGAIVGALIFMIGGYLVSSVTNTAHLQAAAWAPLVLFTWARACAGKSGFIPTALLLVVELLAGAPEVWISTVMLLGAWSLCLAARNFPHRVQLILQLGGCVVVVFLLAAFQVLPTFEYLSLSRRAGELIPTELTYWSMHPSALLQMVAPHSVALLPEADRGMIGPLIEPRLPLVQSIYLGIGGLCLMVAGVIRGRGGWFWALVAATGVLLALGENSFLYVTLAKFDPLFLARIRYPEKFLFLFHLGAVVLVAQGATAVFRDDREALRLCVIVSVTLGLISLFCAMLGMLDPERLLHITAVLSGRGDWPQDAFFESAADFAYKTERAAWLFAGFGGLSFLRVRRRIGLATFALLSLVLLAGDLASTHRGIWISASVEDFNRAPMRIDTSLFRTTHQRIFNYRTERGGTPIPGLGPWIPKIDERTDNRKMAVEGWRTLFFAIGMLHGVGNASAGDSIGDAVDLNRVLERLPREQAIDLLGLYGVAILVGPSRLDTQNVELISSPEETPYVYRVRSAHPHAFLVPSLAIENHEESTFTRLAQPSYPRASQAVVERIPSGWENSGVVKLKKETIVIRAMSADEVVLDVSCDLPRLLVVNTWNFPGWVATIDGRRTEILRTNGRVQGVVIPQGDHVVRFRYDPRWLGFGLTVSIGALIVLVILGCVLRFRRG